MEVNLYHYCVPLNDPILMRGGKLSQRCGWLIETPHGWGEISPLPGFSRETTMEAEVEVYRFAQSLFLDKPFVPQIASTAFAKLMLVYPLPNQVRAIPYSFILGTPNVIFDQIAKLYQEGKRLFKIKAALFPWEQECSLFQKLAATFIEASFIIDANCSLDPQKAFIISNIFGSTLSYLEDPCADIESSLKAHIPLGLDELARDNTYKKYQQSLTELSCYRLVQKPTMNINLCTQVLPQLLQKVSCSCPIIHDELINKLVLSSSFESIIGITYLEQLANYLHLPTPGTDTMHYFPNDAQEPYSFIHRYAQQISIFPTTF